MSEAYVRDLCKQLDALASLAGTSGCVRTRTGKLQVDHSVGAILWRKVVNSEGESRSTAVKGIETLLDTVNDYVASTLHAPPIQRNVTVVLQQAPTGGAVGDAFMGKVLSTDGKHGKASRDNGNADDDDDDDAIESGGDHSTSGGRNNNDALVERSQARFFAECDAQSVERLCELSASLKNSCKGTSAMVSNRYRHDYETVPLLLDQINYTSLIAKRIDAETAKAAAAAATTTAIDVATAAE